MVNSVPSQDFVPIKEIRDGILVLKDGSLRMILLATSLNFSLKSPEEQVAILFQFQNFLNSLDFDTQFAVQSRRLDIRPYIMTLEERLKAELGDLLRVQIKEYIGFVKTLTEQTNIMTKSFYIVIPYAPPTLKQSSVFKKLLRKEEGRVLTSFEENRSLLEQRASVIEQGLGRVGVRTIALGTEELVELFFQTFNPEDNITPTTAEQRATGLNLKV